MHVSLNDLPAFGADGSVQVVVESPRGSSLKLKYDPQHEVFTLSRPLINGLTYPYDWGFVPSTRGPDGDPLDVMLLWDQSSFPGLVLSCRVIGALAVEQNNKKHPELRERNDRLFAVPNGAPRSSDIRDIDDLPRRIAEELEQFFLATAVFENKAFKFLGWSNARDAQQLVLSATAPSDSGQ
jgi:inorganic pyrophosphatase